MTHRNHNRSLLTLLYLFTLVTLALPIFASPDYKVLHSFGDLPTAKDEATAPSLGVIKAPDGNFYGVTINGGISDYGTVFKMTPSGQITILHSFIDGSLINDGANPSTPLVLGDDGYLYGTTISGGAKWQGTVFKISTSGSINIIHSFGDSTTPNDSCYPSKSFLMGPDGNFYGLASSQSGTNSTGTLYKITKEGVVTIIKSFSDNPGLADVSTPFGIMMGSDGNFYGTSYGGGANNYGAIFKITPGGTLSILHSFRSVNNDGAWANTNMIEGTDGYFYGITIFGGAYGGGTIYKISSSGDYSILYSFEYGTFDIANTNIYTIALSLVQGDDGNFYGTTANGGVNHKGTLYKITPTGVFNNLHTFPDNNVEADAIEPTGKLCKGSGGNLYGTSTKGGSLTGGTFFQTTPAGDSITLHSFPSEIQVDGKNPVASLIQGNGNVLYGTTSSGGLTIKEANNFPYQCGTLFKISLDDDYNIFHFFDNYTDGRFPYANLTLGLDGKLYGTTRDGGTYNYSRAYGTLFSITPKGSLTTHYVFPYYYYGNNGTSPEGGVMLSPDGYLYGTTFAGGYGDGSIYKYDPLNNTLTNIYLFPNDVNNGACPTGPLILGSDGNYYGTTVYGGNGILNETRWYSGYGSIFRMASDGTVTFLHLFGNVINDGIYPGGYPIQASDGYIYGVTSSGGTKGYGTIYRMSLLGDITILHSFGDGSVPNDGLQPVAGLIECSDGWLYGTTKTGGKTNNGTIYRLNPSGEVKIVYSFNDGITESDGINPSARLFQASNGNLYGVTNKGGKTDSGTIFRIVTLSTEAYIDGILNTDWYKGKAIVTLSVSDNKGPSDIAATYYTIDGGSTRAYSSPLNFSSDGSHTITYWSVGASGNIEPLNSKTFKIDAVAPITTCIVKGDTVTLSATDIESGVKSTYYKIDGGAQQAYTSPFNVIDNGTHTINFWSVDNVGNVETANVQTFTISIPPTITILSPSSVPGAQTFTLTINGTNCESGSVIKFNGTNMPTTYVSPTQLTASINKYYITLASYPGTATVLVLNPDGKRSSSATVTITKPNPIPTITSLSPSTVSGAKSFTLTVNGTNFGSESIIKWNGTNITTTYVSPTQLTASINKYYTTLSSYPGSATISVLNPDGTRSTNTTLTITAPLPAISSLSPARVQGATTFTLTVNGSNFVNGSIIKWNGTNMTTTFVSATQLTASINKYYDTLSSYPGSATISILNPDGGRSTGATIAITQPITPPTITSLSPSSVSGATNFTLTVNGAGFQSGAVIKWNGTNLTTTFVSSTQLTATIGKYFDTLASYPGSATVSVLNPDSGRSAGATLAIMQP